MEEMNSIITSYNKEKQEIIYHTNNENNYKIVQEICRLYIGRSFMTKEIERLQHNQEVSTKWEIKLTQKNTKLKEENKKLKSIIKEVREYIYKNGIIDLNGYDLLKILQGSDKE